MVKAPINTENAVDTREKNFLTEAEIQNFLKAARKGRRHSIRNFAMLLLAYRHGLRVSELVNMRIKLDGVTRIFTGWRRSAIKFRDHKSCPMRHER